MIIADKSASAPDASATAKRVIDDALSLRALAHPVRLALLDALLGGPLTATQAGEAIGETPTTCSFHLRQLAKYGFVEEVGGGKGRNRPWRRANRSLAIPVRPNDSAFTESAQAVHGIMLDRYFKQLSNLIADFSSLPNDWQMAVAGSQTIVYIDASEAKQLADEYNTWLGTISQRWGDRVDHPGDRPPHAKAVQLLFFSVPTDYVSGRNSDEASTQ